MLDTTAKDSAIIRWSLLDLTQRDYAELPNGCGAYVVSEGETYRLDTSNSFATFSPLIIGRTVANGRWFRRSKAYVVGNFTLWVPNFGSHLGNDNVVYGFTPGQQQSGAAVADIILNLSPVLFGPNLVLAEGTTDVQGNLWLVAFGSHGAANAAGAIYKIALSDMLASGSPTPRLTLNPPQVLQTAADSILFDKSGALWTVIWQTGGATGAKIVKFGAPSYASSGTPIPDAVVTTAPGAGVVTGEFQYSIFNAQGDMWAASFSGALAINVGLIMVSAAQLASSAALITPAVIWNGSNFVGPCDMAFGPDGRLWVADYGTGGAASRLKAFTTVGAASGNPAPDITIAVSNCAGLGSLAFAADGGLWVASQDAGFLVYLSPAQIASTGTVAGTRVLTAPGIPGSVILPLNPSRSGSVPSGVPLIP